MSSRAIEEVEDDLVACSSLLLFGELTASSALRCCNAANGRDVGSFPGQHAFLLPLLLKVFSPLLILFFLRDKLSQDDMRLLCSKRWSSNTAGAQSYVQHSVLGLMNRCQELYGCLHHLHVNLPMNVMLAVAGTRTTTSLRLKQWSAAEQKGEKYS